MVDPTDDRVRFRPGPGLFGRREFGDWDVHFVYGGVVVAGPPWAEERSPETRPGDGGLGRLGLLSPRDEEHVGGVCIGYTVVKGACHY